MVDLMAISRKELMVTCRLLNEDFIALFNINILKHSRCVRSVEGVERTNYQEAIVAVAQQQHYTAVLK